MSKITLEWQLPLISDIKVANRRLSRLHKELAEWHRDEGIDEPVITLLQPRPYTYQCELDEDSDLAVKFLATWQGLDYTVTKQE